MMILFVDLVGQELSIVLFGLLNPSLLLLMQHLCPYLLLFYVFVDEFILVDVHLIIWDIVFGHIGLVV